MTGTTVEFRRVNGHLDVPKLRAVLQRHFREQSHPRADPDRGLTIREMLAFMGRSTSGRLHHWMK